MKILVGRLVGDSIASNAGEHDAIGRIIGTVAIVRIDIDVLVASARIVRPKVEKCGTAEAAGEFPIAPRPGLAVIARPGELRIAGVANEGVQHAIDHQHSASFFAARPIAGLLKAC